MSGDVQPRKRKDKKRKKDSTSSDRSRIDAEFIARKLSLGDDSDEGVSIPVKSSSSHSSSQLGEGDSIIHVHHEGGTGGHWCAKIVFFFLLGILVFLIGLILIENRGLTDLDTPTESRYAQVFDGWVDEGPIHDDHHDEHTLELKHGDEDSHEDDDHDEEHDEEIEDIEDEHGDTEDEDEHTEDEGIGSDEEHADDDNDEDEADNDQDQVIEEDDDENNNDGGEDDDEDEGHNSNELDNDEDENDDDEDDVKKDSGENDEEENLHEIDYDGEGEDDDYLGASQENDDDDDDAEGEDSQLNDSREGDLDNAPFEEVDSMEEEVIENNAGEEEHLAAKKAEQLAQEQEDSGRGKPSGGNSVDDQEEWFDDTSDHWKQQLDLAQAEMDEGHIEEAYRLFTALSMTNKSCPLAKLGLAKVMDVLAEKKRSNNLLQATIDAYLEVLKMDIQDKVFADVANRTINRIRFKGKHLDAVPVHEMLISKFPADPQHRNELAITYLMVNK